MIGPQDGVYGVPEWNSLCNDTECPGLDIWFNQLESGMYFPTNLFFNTTNNTLKRTSTK